MSNYEVLKTFARQPVTAAMVDFLAATTASVIQVKKSTKEYSPMGDLLVASVKPTTPLPVFINRLIEYSNVQAATLMTTLVYLNRLRNILPGNAVGMETTRHRIFLAALILSAKSLNDSSPLNKHWTKYTDGLLTNNEVNLAERELISLLKWNLTVKEDELLVALQPFLGDIRALLEKRRAAENQAKQECYRLSSLASSSSRSLASSRSLSKASIFSSMSSTSIRSGMSSYTPSPRMPLNEKLSSLLNALLRGSKHKPQVTDNGYLAPPARVR